MKKCDCINTIAEKFTAFLFRKFRIFGPLYILLKSWQHGRLKIRFDIYNLIDYLIEYFI